VGQNPPDTSDDPSKLWIIREGSGGSKLGLGGVVVQVEVTIGIKRAIVMGRTEPSSDGFPEGLIDQRFSAGVSAELKPLARFSVL
jgi:hypothetical protein